MSHQKCTQCQEGTEMALVDREFIIRTPELDGRVSTWRRDGRLATPAGTWSATDNSDTGPVQFPHVRVKKGGRKSFAQGNHPEFAVDVCLRWSNEDHGQAAYLAFFMATPRCQAKTSLTAK